MIKPVSKMKAFSLLLDENTASKVYVKTLGSHNYLRAIDHRFLFGGGDRAINVYLAEFYVEERESE